ncbi:MAG: AmmeMemoRadiSam system protein A [Bacilli bacterium]|nr:AmmeMemoRadiSam system protein A [Bacilli bacterium]
MAIVGSFLVPHPPLIIPEVGRGEERQIQKTIDAYKEVASRIAKLKPDTIIISTPHARAYSDYFNIAAPKRLSGNLKEFGAPQVEFFEDNDIELIEKIEEIAKSRAFPTGRVDEVFTLDHASLIPLYFIRQKYNDFKVIILSLSGLSLIEHYAMGMLVNEAVNSLGRKCVWVASGDLSHKLKETGPYGLSKDGVKYDKKIESICRDASFLKLLEMDDEFLEEAGECGHRSLVMMSGALDGVNVQSNFLSHEDITGVGYGVCIFRPLDKNTDRFYLDKYLTHKENEIKEKISREDSYVKLARDTINNFVINKEFYMNNNEIDKDLLNNKAGVFVSIHKFGMLRGCIGTTSPTTDSIAEEIMNNAVNAATNDPRFAPITSDELKWLEVSVDVLGRAEDTTIDGLDPKKYGVIVSSGSKRGVLLPDLPNVITVEEQITIAKRKAGISDIEPIKLQRFEVIRH